MVVHKLDPEGGPTWDYNQASLHWARYVACYLREIFPINTGLSWRWGVGGLSKVPPYHAMMHLMTGIQ